MEDAKEVALDRFIVVGGMSWGKGEDLKEALINWISHESPKGDMSVHIRQVDKEAYVDGMGTLYANRASVKLPDLKVPYYLVKKLKEVEYDILDLLEPIEDEVTYSTMVPA